MEHRPHRGMQWASFPCSSFLKKRASKYPKARAVVTNRCPRAGFICVKTFPLFFHHLNGKDQLLAAPSALYQGEYMACGLHTYHAGKTMAFPYIKAVKGPVLVCSVMNLRLKGSPARLTRASFTLHFRVIVHH